MLKKSKDREFRRLKDQIVHIEELVKNSNNNSLMEQEVTLRKKIKQLKSMKDNGFRGYKDVYYDYMEIYKYVSKRIIEDYNRKNGTDFSFEKTVSEDYDGFIKSGILSVLLTKHIPRILEREFDKAFPKDPKDEYKETRKLKRKFYLHLGETNTGKTYNALQSLKSSTKGVYLSPLRILALENFTRLNIEGVKTNLITGEEEEIIDEATHLSCTIEKLNIDEEYDLAVIDEIQMIADDFRGFAWTRAILGVKAKEVHVCGALNAKDILIKIIKSCGDEYEFYEYKRDIPLIVEDKSFKLKNVKAGDGLVVFSKKKVLELAKYLVDNGVNASVIYGDLPPEVRKKQYKAFIDGDNKVLVTTDAIGMGVNLPLKRIVFMDIRKFDGNQVRNLTSQEIKQIAGRAGRKGIYNEGYVSAYGDNIDFIRYNIETKDEDIWEVVLGPSEAIINIKNIPLKDKLALWSIRDVEGKIYRKMDISEYIIKLENIKYYKLSQMDEWKLMKIPFDVSERELMVTFLNYIDEIFIGKKKELSKPRNFINELTDWEIYYQKIGIYYSFGKNFNIEIDNEWIKEERIKVGNRINKLLGDINKDNYIIKIEEGL
ncbi:DEAD/DEAH box helicase [Clostridium sp. YIM B02551]|uniref:helicase-related protein n=1 Tax=Clostridium sp. YIM B02551 TaxID=2910679 RepID=UPI001EEAC510